MCNFLGFIHRGAHQTLTRVCEPHPCLTTKEPFKNKKGLTSAGASGKKTGWNLKAPPHVHRGPSAEKAEKNRGKREIRQTLLIQAVLGQSADSKGGAVLSPGGAHWSQLRGCWPLVLPVLDCWGCCPEARQSGDSPPPKKKKRCSFSPPPAALQRLPTAHTWASTLGPHSPTSPQGGCPIALLTLGRSPLTPLANCLSTRDLYLPLKPQLGLPITFLNTLPEPQEAGPTHTALCFPLLAALGTTNLGIDTPYLSSPNGQYSRLCTCSVPPAQLRTCDCSHGVKGWVCLCSHNGR